MFNNSKVKLVDVLVRDAEGKPTGGRKARPEYVVMLSEDELTEEMKPYLYEPTHIDDEWAGQKTIYLKFNTETQCRALMSKHLA